MTVFVYVAVNVSAWFVLAMELAVTVAYGLDETIIGKWVFFVTVFEKRMNVVVYYVLINCYGQTCLLIVSVREKLIHYFVAKTISLFNRISRTVKNPRRDQTH